MFNRLGRLAFDQRRWVVAGALIFFAVSALGSRGIVNSLEQGGFFDESSEAATTSRLLGELGIGLGEVDLVLLFDAGEQSIRDLDNLLEVRDLENAVIDTGAFDGRPRSYRQLGSESFISADGTKTVSFFAMSGSETEKRERYANEVKPALQPVRLTVLAGGTVPGAIELNELIESSISRGELVSLPLSFGLLFLVFGGFVAAGLPVLAGVVAVVGALAVTRVIAGLTDMSAFVVVTVTMLGLGVTIDYSLFIVNRYREEMARSGDDVRRAVERTVATAGRSVAFSGITTVLSMGSLLFFNEMIFRSFAFGAMAAVLVAFVNAVILLPALIAILGVNAGRTAERGASKAPWAVARWLGRVALFRLATGFNRFPRTGGEVADHGFWFRIAALGQRWPWPLAGGVLAILIVAGLPFLRLNLSLPDHRVLPADSEARRVVDEIELAFPDRDTRPVKIALTFDEGRALAYFDEIASYSERLLAVPGVRAVTSLTTVELLERQLVLDYESGALDPVVMGGFGEVLGLFANGPTTLLDVSIEADAQSAEARRVLKLVRAVPVPPASSILVGGDTAQLAATRASLAERVPWVIAYIIVVTFIALFLQFGSLVIPAKAILMNAASISASFGALVFVFQDGHFSGLLGFSEVGLIPSVIPVLIFAIAFGLSIDYEIFLISRIQEEYLATGDASVAVARGLQRTGLIITGAAGVLVIVAAAFATSELVFMKQLGVGLALAIFIDATVVRALLVPATMQLMGGANWWAPAPLKRLQQRIGLGEI